MEVKKLYIPVLTFTVAVTHSNRMTERLRGVKLCVVGTWDRRDGVLSGVTGPQSHLRSCHCCTCTASCVTCPPLWFSRVVPAAVNPITHNSSHGLQQYKHKSIAISTPGLFGLNYRLWHCSELFLLLLLWLKHRRLLLWEFWNHGYQNSEIMGIRILKSWVSEFSGISTTIFILFPLDQENV